ncbi:hypothetical protein FQR65_LT17721 [Abscondita terminalis]|nr:hypothetical protein FQR65_LT17721 [Abscondita terminalis]
MFRGPGYSLLDPIQKFGGQGTPTDEEERRRKTKERKNRRDCEGKKAIPINVKVVRTMNQHDIKISAVIIINGLPELLTLIFSGTLCGRMLVLDYLGNYGVAPSAHGQMEAAAPNMAIHVQSVGLMLDYDYKAELTARKKEWTCQIKPRGYTLLMLISAAHRYRPPAWIKDGILVGITRNVAIEPIPKKW